VRKPSPIRLLLAALVLLALNLHAGVPAQSQAGAAPTPGSTRIATFAGGCFWCTEADFDKMPGVLATVSGFMGGKTASPTYEQVVTGTTGHTEVVQVTFDPARITYKELVERFWRTIDPLDPHGQFCDKGNMYRTAIFVHDEEQKRVATESKAALAASGRFKQPIVTEVVAAGPFTAASEKHQDFYKKNPGHYAAYRRGCGRDARLEQLWGKAEAAAGR
jgi:peptide-methionine (S)-S-oxide reductase